MPALLVQQTLKILEQHGLEAKLLSAPQEGCELLEVSLVDLASDQTLQMSLLFVEQSISLQELAKPMEYWALQSPLETPLEHLGTTPLNAAQAMAESTNHASPTLYQVQVETTLLKALNEASAVDLMRLAHLINRGLMGSYFCIDEMSRSVLLKMNGLFNASQAPQLIAQLGQHLFFLAAHSSAFQQIHEQKISFESWFNAFSQELAGACSQKSIG